jgi:hypothetical protein
MYIPQQATKFELALEREDHRCGRNVSIGDAETEGIQYPLPALFFMSPLLIDSHRICHIPISKSPPRHTLVRTAIIMAFAQQPVCIN